MAELSEISDTQDQDEAIRSVLIVDDDPILCAVAESYFQNRGIDMIRTAENGAQALETLDANSGNFDFILCDLNMPKMDGVQLFHHLKHRDFAGSIVIISGEQETIVSIAENLAAKHELNIVASLRKPLDFRKLDQVIAKTAIPVPKHTGLQTAEITRDDLDRGIKAGEMVVYYQPKIEVATRKVRGAEALVRWNHPDKGLISPAQFVPLAEQCGLITDLTISVLHKVIDDAALWMKFRQNFRISINLSVDVLRDLSFPDKLAEWIDDAGLDRSVFVLEITESRLLEKDTVPMEVFARLRMMGFDLSIDDFGTGYSNIEHLKEFPFSELKIDQSFVKESSLDPRACAIVESSAALGKMLGLRMVAEGVETVIDWEFVASLGVDEVQGFFFGKPMPFEKLMEWMFDFRSVNGNFSYYPLQKS